MGFVVNPLNPVQVAEINSPDDSNTFVALTTIIDRPTQMRVQLPANQLATPRTSQLRIRHTDVGVSNVVDLVISGSTLSISPLSASKAEGHTATTPFTVTRNGNTSSAATVDYIVKGRRRNNCQT